MVWKMSVRTLNATKAFLLVNFYLYIKIIDSFTNMGLECMIIHLTAL